MLQPCLRAHSAPGIRLRCMHCSSGHACRSRPRGGPPCPAGRRGRRRAARPWRRARAPHAARRRAPRRAPLRPPRARRARATQASWRMRPARWRGCGAPWRPHVSRSATACLTQSCTSRCMCRRQSTVLASSPPLLLGAARTCALWCMRRSTARRQAATSLAAARVYPCVSRQQAPARPARAAPHRSPRIHPASAAALVARRAKPARCASPRLSRVSCNPGTAACENPLGRAGIGRVSAGRPALGQSPGAQTLARTGAQKSAGMRVPARARLGPWKSQAELPGAAAGGTA